MAYWWVNQNQTYDQEISGGYMWSPKRNSHGGYNQFYENMKLVQSGDIVFSFRKQLISDVGVIQNVAHSSQKPSEFGTQGDYWSNEGWFVPVSWHSLKQPFSPKQNFDAIRPTLLPKYAPLSAKTGTGLQGVYLAEVPEAMAEVIIGKLSSRDKALIHNAEDYVAENEDLRESIEAEIVAQIAQDTSIDTTERESIIKARKGQGRYRKNLELIEIACRLTGVTDKRLLRASHIKPWSRCDSNHERLDGNNGLLLTPSIDLLFDQGYISFEDDGQMLVSAAIDKSQFLAMGIQVNDRFRTQPFNQEQCAYLEFHRNIIFKN